FHQNLDPEAIIEQCKKAKELGYEAVIIDDGWQTLDNKRGYDYTGDWLAERIPEIKDLVANLHAIGMKVGLWYSVPFCGNKSRAYSRFKNNLLTRQHRWAPVLDPRYPAVREYLINTYTSAVRDWGLDGLKLDFIDEFKVYPETRLTKSDGRDTASVNEGVTKLLSGVIEQLCRINPDVFIEFRQKYIGPAIRQYGNMLRAFDCPNDSNSQRERIVDVRLLSGITPVHSDMFTWHPDEPVELAALQLLNALFGVPQLSVDLTTVKEDHRRMIRFYTNYWVTNRDILMHGKFTPKNPTACYTTVSASSAEKTIVVAYSNQVIKQSDTPEMDIINAKRDDQVALSITSDKKHLINVYDCMGKLLQSTERLFATGVHLINVPTSGLIALQEVDHE
ncbi:MAG: glycoside hydrolase family 36 protein, partial [Bacteroidota bacterium]